MDTSADEMVFRLTQYRRGFGVERLHTTFHMMPYTNGYHSANAALLAMELCKLNNMHSSVPSVMEYMLKHDLAERELGDAPAPIKRLPVMKQAYDRMERKWYAERGIELPDLHPDEEHICYIADKLELGMYCAKEFRRGNEDVQAVINNILNWMRNEFDIKGVEEIFNWIAGEV